MTNRNFRLLLGVIVAYLLLAISFTRVHEFWPLFSMSLGVLVLLSIWQQKWKVITLPHLLLGIGSGVLLYGVFALGNAFLHAIHSPLIQQLKELYNIVSPKEVWHYVVLFLLIIPGEEWFWRGFVQTQLRENNSSVKAVIFSTLLYAGAHIMSGSMLLVLAAILGGMIWGFLYERTNSIGIAILSHLLFDVLLLILFPLL